MYERIQLQHLRKKWKGEEVQIIVRFRCGNSEETILFGKEKKRRGCESSGSESETLVHGMNGCGDERRTKRGRKKLLHKAIPGIKDMKTILKRLERIK